MTAAQTNESVRYIGYDPDRYHYIFVVRGCAHSLSTNLSPREHPDVEAAVARSAANHAAVCDQRTEWPEDDDDLRALVSAANGINIKDGYPE